MTLNEFVIANPMTGLFIASMVVTIISTFAHKYMTNQKELKIKKARQKELQKELRGCKDPKKISELNSEMLKITGFMFRASTRPLMLTIIPFLILFTWLRGIYSPIMGQVHFIFPVWLWWYLGFSMILSSILRKMLDVA